MAAPAAPAPPARAGSECRGGTACPPLEGDAHRERAEALRRALLAELARVLREIEGHRPPRRDPGDTARDARHDILAVQRAAARVVVPREQLVASHAAHARAHIGAP